MIIEEKLSVARTALRGTALRLLAALAMILLVISASNAHAKSRVALVIGNSKYEHTSPLPNPQSDAGKIAEVLKKIGFDAVDLKVDLGVAAMRQELLAFNAKAKAADVAMVFYAGHGMEFGGKNFLIPTDARLLSDADIEWEVVPLDLVLTAAQASKLQIVILDACRNNPMAANMQVAVPSRAAGLGMKRTTNQGFASVSPQGSMLIAYAAKHGSVAYDGAEANSPYTMALAEHLPTPATDIRIVLGMVHDNVVKRTKGAQEPFVYGAMGGTQLFLVPGAAAPTGAPPSNDAKEQKFWSTIEASKSAEMFSLYLQIYPDGPHAAEAKERLAALGQAPGPTPSTDPNQWPMPGASPSPGQSPAQKLSGDLAIAVAGPMSGAFLAFGQEMQRGAEAAIAEVNASGGVLGKRLKLVTGDDQCDPKTAVQLASKFVGEAIPFVAGHFCSGASIPASDVYDENGVVMISPASSNLQLTSRGRQNTFRIVGRDDQQGKYAGNFLARHYGQQRIAVVHDGTTYAKTLTDEMLAALQRLDKQPVLVERIQQNQRDFSQLVEKLASARADVLYFGGLQFEGGMIARQMREAGLKTVLVSGDGLMTEDFEKIAGRSAAEGTLITSQVDPRQRLEAAGVVERFRKQKIEPGIYTLYTYAAVQAWAEAADRAGSTEAAKVSRVLKTGRFSTVLGTVGFDANGDVTIPGFAFYRWTKGKFEQLQ